MKPWILISSGIVLALLLIFWMFLFFAGDDTRAELFNALNFGDTTGEGLPFEDFFDSENEDEADLAALRQLTLRRVAGYMPYKATASSTAVVYVAEAGTGHIYTIDPLTGTEERISNITVPAAVHAVFSSDKSFVVVRTADNSGTLTVISLPREDQVLDSYSIAADTFSYTLTDNNILLYAEQNNSSVVAYSYDLNEKVKTSFFTLPFRDASIIWGSDVSDTHLAYPKTSSQLEGYLYRIKNNVLSRLPISGFGLSAVSNGETIIFTNRANDTYQTTQYDIASKANSRLPYAFLPEKCTLVTKGLLCGLSSEAYTEQSPDTWYSGEVTYSDTLWYIDTVSGESSSVIDLESESGRQLDVTSLQVEPGTSTAFFVNKSDQALWIYEGDFIINSGDN
jgi:hypothetical protein